jgi:GNAT superfamily N-acetyltransferase
MKYVVQPQNYDDLLGELILANWGDTVVGKTGYVAWKQNEYAQNGNTALMKMIFDSPPDIVVEQSMRKKGIGHGLMDKLVDRLAIKNYNMLLIAQPDGEKKIYSKMLGKLFKKGKIRSVHYGWAIKLGPVYEIKMSQST